MPSYTQESFEQVVCEKCGRDQGMFVIAESTSERTVILCSECRYEYPTSDQVDFDAALESSVNWERESNKNGLIVLSCVHCGEEHTENWSEEDMPFATAFLEADKEHKCEEEEEDEEDTSKGDKKVLYNGIEYSVMQDDIERDGEAMLVIGIPPVWPHMLYSSITTVRAKDCEFPVEDEQERAETNAYGGEND